MPSFYTLTRALVLALACAATTVVAFPAELPPASLSTVQKLSAIAEAEALGIDVHGAIPDDFTSFDEKLGRYDFEAGSKASAWARAQLAVSSLPETKGANPTLEKRNSGVGMGMWYGSWCSGGGWYIPNVVYGTTYYNTGSPYTSVGISGRSLGNWEQLDFSTYTSCPTHGCSPVACGAYLYSAGTYTEPGCWNSMNYYCAKLWTY